APPAAGPGGTGTAPKVRELVAAGPSDALAVASKPGVTHQPGPGQAATRADQAPPAPGRARPRPRTRLTRRTRAMLAAAAALALTLGTATALTSPSPPARGRAQSRPPTTVRTPALPPDTLLAKGASVDHAVFSPDGTTLASASRHQRTIRLWNVSTGSNTTTLTAPGNVLALA